MSDLQQNRAIIIAEIGVLAERCRKGDHVAACVVAFCGARCSQVLVETISESPLGKRAIEKAASLSAKWPIAYPALEDGRTNRIKEQVPLMLGKDLGLRVNAPKGTGKHRSAPPEVRTFLEESLHQVGPDGKNYGSQSSRAAIMAALIALFHRCKTGDSEAASSVAECGVLFSELLADLLRLPRSSEGRKAAESAAREAPEWPTVFGATKKGTHYLSEVSTPSMLGQGLEFRIEKHEGTKSDREFDEDQRVGFAFKYFMQLKRGRHLARIYKNPRIAFWWELARQGHAAWLILSRRGFRPDFVKMSKVDAATIREITNSLWEVVPRGLGDIWEILPQLPALDSRTVEIWTHAAMALAKAKCGGDWVNGPWPQSVKSDALSRCFYEPRANPEGAYEEAVGLWMKYGFLKLADGLRH